MLLNKAKKIIKEYYYARKYMRTCIIVGLDNKMRRLTLKYVNKKLAEWEFSKSEIKKMPLPEKIYWFEAESNGGTTIYDRQTGEITYCGYAS